MPIINEVSEMPTSLPEFASNNGGVVVRIVVVGNRVWGENGDDVVPKVAVLLGARLGFGVQARWLTQTGEIWDVVLGR